MERQTDGNAQGGVHLAGANSVEDCNAGCLAQESCRAIDFNTGSQRCYIHTAVSENVRDGPCCERYIKICDGTLVKFQEL